MRMLMLLALAGWLATVVPAASAAPRGGAVAPRARAGASTPAGQRAKPGQRGAARIAGAMGILPLDEVAVPPARNLALVYHGGTVVHGVTLHTVFWAPPGYPFGGSPDGRGYRGVIEQFLAGVAADSGSRSNVFSILTQLPDDHGPGSYRISYDATRDSVLDARPFPPLAKQCASPGGSPACVSDLQVQHELQRVVSATHGAAGLHDLWIVLLPPAVDTCLLPGVCGTNAFGGYHALSLAGGTPLLYALVPDPLLAGPEPAGADPQGDPEAEEAIDVIAHEVAEGITDPEGTGWMDPAGGEVGDKCETPQAGVPLGYAPNGSPYNQVIGGRSYLIQEMWSNAQQGCVQRATTTLARPGLARVSLGQFSPTLRGSIPAARAGVSVRAALLRAGRLVALVHGQTRADGSWGPLVLRDASGVPQGVGDDRDQLVLVYGHGGPRPEVIQPGNGGDPFQEAGFTSWWDLDHGYAVRSGELLLAPCSQTGVLRVRIGGRTAPDPVVRCGVSSDTAQVPLRGLGPAARLTMTSQDNRAADTSRNLRGALVSFRLALGEPDSVSAVANRNLLFEPSGFPACTADLRAQAVTCSGLVPGARYRLERRRGASTRVARAGDLGRAVFGGFPRPGGRAGVGGGDILSLRNGSGRLLTVLHVAHLQVWIRGAQTVLGGGRCEPGAYWGAPLSPPVGTDLLSSRGPGTICPLDGDASGRAADAVEQTDPLGAGTTRTEVPALAHPIPADGATLYGAFLAVARASLPAPHHSRHPAVARIALSIFRAGGRSAVFRAADVSRPDGAAVPALAPGVYTASWTVIDANGDRRFVRTSFAEAPRG